MTRFEKINQLVAEAKSKLQEAIKECDKYYVAEEGTTNIADSQYYGAIKETRKFLNAILTVSNGVELYYYDYKLGEKQ